MQPNLGVRISFLFHLAPNRKSDPDGLSSPVARQRAAGHICSPRPRLPQACVSVESSPPSAGLDSTRLFSVQSIVDLQSQEFSHCDRGTPFAGSSQPAVSHRKSSLGVRRGVPRSSELIGRRRFRVDNTPSASCTASCYITPGELVHSVRSVVVMFGKSLQTPS